MRSPFQGYRNAVSDTPESGARQFCRPIVDIANRARPLQTGELVGSRIHLVTRALRHPRSRLEAAVQVGAVKRESSPSHYALWGSVQGECWS